MVNFRATSHVKDSQRNGVRIENPKLPWITFHALISALSKFLPPQMVKLITKYHNDHKRRKITRRDLIQQVRKLARDELLTAIIKPFKNKSWSHCSYLSKGRSILFMMPSEMKMLEKLEEKKKSLRVIKANGKTRGFVTYLKFIHKQRDKEIFDVTKLPIDEFSVSWGLPMAPKIQFLQQKLKGKIVSEALSLISENTRNENLLELPIKKSDTAKTDVEEVGEDLFLAKETQEVGENNSKGNNG